jgi:glutaredoxin-like YruB-family protein
MVYYTKGGPKINRCNHVPIRRLTVTVIKQITTILLLLTVTSIGPTLPVYAANSGSSQTILNPAAVKKSPYPKIVIYTVAWCPHCRELKEYLTSRNIPFINRDVELDATAMQDLENKYNSRGVPVVVIGNNQEVLKGFTAEEFEALVQKVRSGSNDH